MVEIINGEISALEGFHSRQESPRLNVVLGKCYTSSKCEMLGSFKCFGATWIFLVFWIWEFSL